MDTFCRSSLQWLDLEWFFSVHDHIPVGPQLLLVQLCPSQCQSCLSAGNIPLEEFTCRDVNDALMLIVVYMKMWWRMFSRGEIHPWGRRLARRGGVGCGRVRL